MPLTAGFLNFFLICFLRSNEELLCCIKDCQPHSCKHKLSSSFRRSGLGLATKFHLAITLIPWRSAYESWILHEPCTPNQCIMQMTRPHSQGGCTCAELSLIAKAHRAASQPVIHRWQDEHYGSDMGIFLLRAGVKEALE